MGYHITIRRDGGVPITESEFEHAAPRFSQLRYDASAGKAGYFRNDELRATLVLQDGEIWTKVAEPDVVKLMARIAGVLDARAFGDEGEWYSEDGAAHVDADREQDGEGEIDEIARLKRRRLLLNVMSFTLVAFVLLLMYLNKH